MNEKVKRFFLCENSTDSSLPTQLVCHQLTNQPHLDLGPNKAPNVKLLNLNKDLINFDQDYQSTSDKNILFNSDRVTHRKSLSIDTDNNSHFKLKLARSSIPL